MSTRAAVITGAAGGLGRVFAAALAGQGIAVAGIDIADTGPAAAAVARVGGQFTGITADITDPEVAAVAVGEAAERLGGLDILVNNAGILEFGSLEEMSLESYRRILEVNLVSQWLGTKHGSAVMNEGGSIVNISSVNGLVGGNRLTAYSSSKFGVTGLTKSAAIELGPKKIRVNSVHPGAVATPLVGRTDDDAEDTAG
ncbi:MAG TPA: SDR family oxidoreductase, partial [Streptosporangiaceae bacterium]|nr:SDR family oxidoreductase [Streptosporangiaceae bacterium]